MKKKLPSASFLEIIVPSRKNMALGRRRSNPTGGGRIKTGKSLSGEQLVQGSPRRAPKSFVGFRGRGHLLGV